MPKPHPIELRERVVAHVEEGDTHRGTAAHFRVSVKFVNYMVNAPPAQAGGFRLRLKAIRSAIRRTARSANTEIIIRLRRLLGLYVLNPHIVRHIAARANPIATRPQMLTPVTLAQAAKLSQQFVRTTALQMLNCLADRKPRRNRYQQVHVVTIDVRRVDDHVVHVRGFPDQFPTTQADISAKHLVPVFRRPYDMVLTVPNRVAASFVTLHAPSLERVRIT